MNKKTYQYIDIIEETLGQKAIDFLLDGLPEGDHPERKFDEDFIREIAEICQRIYERFVAEGNPIDPLEQPNGWLFKFQSIKDIKQ